MSTSTNNPNAPHTGSSTHKPNAPGPDTAMNQMLMKQHDAPKAPFGALVGGTSGYVQFKGRPGLLEMIIDAEAPLLAILQDLQQSLLANQALLEHLSAVKLNFGAREVDKLQFNEIQRVVMAHRLKITGLVLQPEALSSFLEGEFGVPVQIQLPTAVSTPRMEKSAQTSAHTEAHPTPVDVLRQDVSHIAAPSSLESGLAPQRRVIAGGVVGASPAPVVYTPDAMPSLDPLPTLSSLEETRRPAAQPTRAQHPTAASAGSVSRQPQAPSHAAAHVVKPPSSSLPSSLSAEPSQSENVSQRALHKIMRTCRAGTSLHFDGDVVIFGDLNAGAEVKATGDIIVLGALLGVAHAGCQGDTSARIYASDLSPTQLRVAHQIAIAPPSQNSRQRSRLFFDMAFLNDEQQIEVKSVEAGRVPA